MTDKHVCGQQCGQYITEEQPGVESVTFLSRVRHTSDLHSYHAIISTCCNNKIQLSNLTIVHIQFFRYNIHLLYIQDPATNHYRKYQNTASRTTGWPQKLKWCNDSGSYATMIDNDIDNTAIMSK